MNKFIYNLYFNIYNHSILIMRTKNSIKKNIRYPIGLYDKDSEELIDWMEICDKQHLRYSVKRNTINNPRTTKGLDTTAKNQNEKQI